MLLLPAGHDILKANEPSDVDLEAGLDLGLLEGAHGKSVPLRDRVRVRVQRSLRVCKSENREYAVAAVESVSAEARAC